MLDNQGNPGTPEPKRDLDEIFDLSRKKLTRSMVDRYEAKMREADQIKDDIAQITAECKDAGFKPRDIKAMKKIAKLRKDDKGGAAREQLEALQRIGDACGFDLFDWAAVQ